MLKRPSEKRDPFIWPEPSYRTHVSTDHLARVSSQFQPCKKDEMPSADNLPSCLTGRARRHTRARANNPRILPFIQARFRIRHTFRQMHPSKDFELLAGLSPAGVFA